jgi:hypothetical protein
MEMSRWKLSVHCAGRVIVAMTAAAAGGTLFGLMCGVIHAALKWDAGLVLAWLERFAVSGLIAGVIVGVCAACDCAANFDAPADRGATGPTDREERADWPAISLEITARRHAAHEVNGRK